MWLMVPYCVYIWKPLCSPCFREAPGKNFSLYMFNGMLNYIIWSLFLCYSHFASLIQATVVYEGRCILAFQGSSRQASHANLTPRPNGMKIICMHSCITGMSLGKSLLCRCWSCTPGMPLGKLTLCSCESQPCNLFATLRSREASGQGLHCVLILHLSMWWCEGSH